VTSAATSAPAQERGAHAPSNTPTVLRRLRTALVALAVLAGATAALLTFEQHAVSSSAGEHTATAVMQAYAARQALVDADSQALDNVNSPQAVQTIPLGAGPSGQYQDDIAAAAQSLEQVAENNTAGTPGTQALQLIEGLLPAYTGLVAQADANYGAQGSKAQGSNGSGVGSGVGVANLWSASELMHDEILTDGQHGEIRTDGQPDPQSAARACLRVRQPTPSDQLDSLADLQCYEQQVLSGQRSSPWVNPWLFAGWVVVALAMASTLAAAQRQFSVRLHRMLSKYLTLAAAALIGLGVVTAHVITSDHAFDAAQSGPLATVLSLQDYQTATTDALGQSALAKVIEPACAQCAAEQGMGAPRAEADAAVTTTAHAALARAHYLTQDPHLTHVPGDITVQQRAYDADTRAATAGYLRSLMLIVVLTALLVLLIFLGFRRHLDEYRYQS
jgi:hypothetical protein